MDTKWFWESLDSAKAFIGKYPDLNHIVEARVPSSIIETSSRVGNHDGIGPALYFIDDALIELNKVITSIKEVMIAE